MHKIQLIEERVRKQYLFKNFGSIYRKTNFFFQFNTRVLLILLKK